MEIVANFSLKNNPINARFNVSDSLKMNAVFQANIGVQIEGKGLINVDKSGNKYTISSKTYVHEQGIASDEWLIQHNLNKYPSVFPVDSAGTWFQAKVEYIDENTCRVLMNGATKGKAYLN